MAVSWDQTGLPHAFLRAAAPVFYEVSGGSLLCEKLNDLTVLTNDLRIALLLYPSKEPRTIMLGGRILREMGGVAGALAAEELASLLLMTSRGQMFRGACEEAGAFCLQPVFAARRAGSGCAVLFDGLEGRGVAGGLPPRLRCVHVLGERHGFLQQAHRFDAARQYRRGDRRHRHHADQQGGAAGGACQLHRTYGDPGRVVALPRSADDVRGDGLRVFFLTRHMSLREVCDAVKKDRVRSSLSSSRQSSSASSAASAISRSSRASPRGSAARSAASASSSASAS